MKLQEGNIFIPVCHSVQKWGAGSMRSRWGMYDKDGGDVTGMRHAWQRGGRVWHGRRVVHGTGGRGGLRKKMTPIKQTAYILLECC